LDASHIFFDDREPVNTGFSSSVPKSTIDRIAAEFTTFLDDWHSSPEVYDNDLDAWIHEIYAKSLRGKQLFPDKSAPYFSPSSANNCRRELYMKAIGAPKDARISQPHQGRWTRIGTAIGDVIQRDMLFAERHMKPSPRFIFERNADGTPMFEDFAKKSHMVEHNGKRFSLYGTCDGVMRYISPDGEILRIGLEIKSKQTTYAQTSDYSTRTGPKPDHIAQVTAYGIMYDVDIYLIVYINGSKKSWELTPDEYAKSPDTHVFGVVITDAMKETLLDDLADIVDAVDRREPPLMNIEKFTFNGYKRACVDSLTDDEVTNLRHYADAVARSDLPDWRKKEPRAAMAYIDEVRRGI
jgi:hypothetical protein